MSLRCECSLQLLPRQTIPGVKYDRGKGGGAVRMLPAEGTSISFARSEIVYAPLSDHRSHPRHVCLAGGARQRKPQLWKTKTRRGTVNKGNKLVEMVLSLSNVKEEVYGALDAWTAWELEFPLVAVKKALKVLQQMKEYKRVIQLTKWMLSKGQGRTLNTYDTLIQAYNAEGRIEEAEALWEKVFAQYMECVPRVMFGRVVYMYESHGMSEKAIELFLDMEELGVKPDRRTAELVAGIYAKMGKTERQEEILAKYPRPMFEWRRYKGKWIRARIQESPEDFPYDSDSQHDDESGNDEDGYTDEEDGIQGTQEDTKTSADGSQDTKDTKPSADDIQDIRDTKTS